MTALAPLVLVAIGAGIALAQFLVLGSPVFVRPDGVVRTDPLAEAAPVLVLLAGALAAPVIAGPVIAVVERLARGGRGILPVLPLRQLARSARTVAAAVLVVALAAGALTLAALFQAGANQARESAERAATGADVRVLLPGSHERRARSPRRRGHARRHRGVDDVFPVLTTTAGVGGETFTSWRATCGGSPRSRAERASPSTRWPPCSRGSRCPPVPPI
ncbi:MAG: hypothetical protein R2717_03560 [Schumannella sp.]